MLTILSTAVQFAAAYVATDSALHFAKKLKRNRCTCDCHPTAKSQINYAPLFAG